MAEVMRDGLRQPLQCFLMLCNDLLSQRNATIPNFSTLFLLLHRYTQLTPNLESISLSCSVFSPTIPKCQTNQPAR